MSSLPKLLKGDRVFDAVTLPLLSIAQAFLIAVGVFATREAFTALHSGTGIETWTLAKLILAGLAGSGIEFLRRVLAERLGQSYAASLRLRLYEQLAGMNKSELDNRRLGALSLRFVGDLSAARNWFGKGVPRILAAAAIVPGAAITLWMLDSRIAMSSGSVLFLGLLVMGAVAVGLGLRHETLRSRRANIAIAMMERIALAPMLDLLGRTERELKALDQQNGQLKVGAIEREKRAARLGLVPQVALTLALAVALWDAARLGTSTGTTAAILSILAVLVLPLRELALSWDHYCAWRIARRKLEVLLSKESRLREPVAANQPVGLRAKGRIAGTEVDLDVPAGETLFLTGGTDQVLSTLARSMAGLDNRPTLDVTYKSETSDFPNVQFIGDPAIALQGSLRRTMTLGISPRPTSRRILRMAEKFGITHLLPEKKKSLRERISEHARNLSPADSLRLELARAALANPDIVIIDTVRFDADPHKDALLKRLALETESTIVVVDRYAASGAPIAMKNAPLAA